MPKRNKQGKKKKTVSAEKSGHVSQPDVADAGNSAQGTSSRCNALNPWCECCGCEKPARHSGKHRVTYDADRVTRWSDKDTARITHENDKKFKACVTPLALKYRNLMKTGAAVREGTTAIYSKTDEHRLHGGLMMLNALLTDTIVRFRHYELRMPDSELDIFLTQLLGDYTPPIVESVNDNSFHGMPAYLILDMYGIVRENRPSPKKLHIKVGKKKLKMR